MTPPTVEQLLILADRAEYGGGLSQVEADRLRRGIHHLDAERGTAESERRLTARRLSVTASRRRDGLRRLAAIRALVVSARQRSVRTVPVSTLAAVLGGSVEVGSVYRGPSLSAGMAPRSDPVGAWRQQGADSKAEAQSKRSWL